MSLLPLPDSFFPSRNRTKADTHESTHQDHNQITPIIPTFRLTSLTSRYYFGVTRRVWNIFLITLPLEWLILIAPPLPTHTVFAVSQITWVGTALIALGVLLWWLRDTILDLLFALHHIQQRMALSSMWPALTLIGLVLAVTLLELISKFAEINLTSVVIGLVVAFGALQSILKALRERRKEAQHLAHDRTSQIERANYAMFLTSLIPAALIRIGIVVGVISLVVSRAPLYEAFALAACGTLALLSCQPILEHFTFACARCGTLTSRAIRSGTLCPMCIIESRAMPHSVLATQESWPLKLLRKAEKFSASTAKTEPQSNHVPHSTSEQRHTEPQETHAERVEKVLRILSAILNPKR